MVDSIKSAAISSLLRAQTTQATRQTSQAITIDQPQKSAVIRVKAAAVPQTNKTAGPSTNLPRGSLVDKLV